MFAEGDEDDEDADADEPPAPVVKLRGKKVRRVVRCWSIACLLVRGAENMM